MAGKQPPFEGGNAEVGYRLAVFGPVLGMRARFKVSMRGLWNDPALMVQFKKEVVICFQILGAHKSGWDVYGDLTGYQAQPEDIGEGIIDLMKQAKLFGFKKAGIVSHSSVVKIAVIGWTFVARMDNLEVFKTQDEAEAFLRKQ